jgi:hypothetical protein
MLIPRHRELVISIVESFPYSLLFLGHNFRSKIIGYKSPKFNDYPCDPKPMNTPYYFAPLSE